MQNPLATIEEERREHQAKMAKMEKEMEEVFERKVREKKNKLNDSENDLEKRHRESKEKLDAQKRELEAQRAAFLVRNVPMYFGLKSLGHLFRHLILMTWWSYKVSKYSKELGPSFIAKSLDT